MEFALEVVDTTPEIRRQLERVLEARGDPQQASTRLKTQIDSALSVGFIEESEVDAFIAQCDGVLKAILALGERSPKGALELVWYYLEETPKTFDEVHDEIEQSIFCRDLMEAAVKLTRAAKAPELELGQKLLDAYIADEYGKMDDAVDVILAAGLSTENRQALAAVAKEKAKRLDEYEKKKLIKFAGQLVKGKTTSRPRFR
ncbi:MAG: hypothetical protein HY303_04660 [Candidatus Wallbacteria bacterium]|nr:hypothetical protein [Candidatus Wallbacteria bacterium]